MLPLGTQAPEFCLLDVKTNSKISLTNKPSHLATVIMFICNHCPYVKHVSHELTNLANDFMNKDILFYAINSNDIENYPDDSPINMKKMATEQGYPFPYLYDETQEVAMAYQAKCTPEFYVFDKHLSLVYRGQLDNSRPGNNIPVTGESVRTALNCLLTNKPIPSLQEPSLGCSIKWKKD